MRQPASISYSTRICRCTLLPGRPTIRALPAPSGFRTYRLRWYHEHKTLPLACAPVMASHFSNFLCKLHVVLVGPAEGSITTKVESKRLFTLTLEANRCQRTHRHAAYT